ncbi:M50 family metallopeptidase [Hyphococcus luteus]|uniref:RIP metalloprotease RseP n=1 Tax=Hyphococcus luteus TaxID=2058213 RepID=A0A2S7JYW6_9PROT|nr:RIP metalloprotease [Marinicaulis flavus]PQA85388.1 RIP metalloprotease RseP [Marinicaulis flavus]
MPFAETLIAVLFSATAFIALLMIIVFVHEYGHFSVARLLGVKVDVFSIGFGKPIMKWIDRKGTEWRISWLPLGGYVKFFGDLNAASQGPAEASEKPVTTQFPKPSEAEAVAGQMSAEERAVCFHFKPLWRRAAVVAAGPFANFILAVAIFAALFMFFGRAVVDPVVGGVAEGSAAQEAGFLPGDRIIEVDGRKITEFADMYDVVIVSGGNEMNVVVERDGAREAIAVTPRRVESVDRYDNKITRWQLGIAPPGSDHVSFRKYGPVRALGEGIGELGRILAMTVKYIGNIVLGKEDARQLGGPIKMAKYAGQSIQSGFDDSSYREPPGFLTKLRASLVDFISLAAVVSVSIGFLNLLPIPVLDGGHLLYYAYEAVAGRPLGARAQAFGFRLGLVLLASLMIFVTWNDINS